MNFKEFLNDKLDESANLSNKEDLDYVIEKIVNLNRRQGVSIRSVEYHQDAKTLSVTYNYDGEAPEGFIKDKAECRKIINANVLGILKDADLKIKSKSNTNDQENVAMINYVI